MRILTAFLLTLALLTGDACKLKPRAGETSTEFKTRQQAVYLAQSVTGLNAWSDAVEILGNGSALEPDARRIQYTINDQVLTGLDIVRERLRNPVTGDGLAKLKGVLLDLREAQRREVVKIKNADTRAQIDTIFEISLFALESLQAVLEESKQPTRADLEAKTEALQSKAKAAIPPYLTALIGLARDAGFAALRQSRLTTADAWANGESLSGQLHSKNAARLAALPAQVL